MPRQSHSLNIPDEQTPPWPDQASNASQEADSLADQSSSEKFADSVSAAGAKAADTVREITESVGEQAAAYGRVATQRATSIAEATAHQAQSWASQVADLTRRQPLTALASALLLGILIGLRRKRS